MSNPLPQSIQHQLDTLRRSLRVWLGIDGVSRILALSALLVGVSFVADFFFRMDRAQRVISLLIGVALLAGLAWRRLLQPLMKNVHDDTLCHRVEEVHPELGQSLISAVQFSRLGEATGSLGYSPALLRQSIELGTQNASNVEFGKALNLKDRNRNIVLAAAVLAVLIGAAAAFPATLNLWFSRNVLLSNVTWPRETNLQIQGLRDGALALPRGDDLTMLVDADPHGVVPSRVQIEYEVEATGESAEEPLVQVGEHAFKWTMKNVLNPIRFRVEGGDHETEWFELRLVDRPTLEKITIQVTPPAYTGLSEAVLPEEVGSNYVWKGSRMAIQGHANKDLEEVQLFRGKTPLKKGTLASPREVSLALTPEEILSGIYSLKLKDRDGLESSSAIRFSLRVRTDQKPNVRAQIKGLGEMITVRATIPLEYRIHDDFAITKANLRHMRRPKDAQDQASEFQEKVIFAHEAGAKNRQELAETLRFEVEPLSLEAGDQFLLRLEAADNDEISGPNLGQSATFSLRVVTDSELRAELLRREQEQREELVRLINTQKSIREATLAIKTGIEKGEGKPDEILEHIRRSEKQQRLIGGRCESIGEQFFKILDEMLNNKLEEPNGPIQKRMQSGIIIPLQSVARGPIPQAASQLQKLLKKQLTVETQKQGLDEILAKQDQIIEDLRAILRVMVKWETYQEAVALLKEILKTQQHVNEATIKEQKKRIEKIFDN